LTFIQKNKKITKMSYNNQPKNIYYGTVSNFDKPLNPYKDYRLDYYHQQRLRSLLSPVITN